MIIGGKEKYAGAGLVLSFANQQLSSCDDRSSALTFNIFLLPKGAQKRYSLVQLNGSSSVWVCGNVGEWD